MAIAGVKPVKIDYLDDVVLIANAGDEPEAETHSGFPMTFVGYDETMVREILIKFSVANDIDHIAAAENMTLNELIDEFIESGEDI